VTTEVSILIVTYRCRAEVRECLGSIAATTADVAHEVVVVDNASGDGTVEMIREDWPDVQVIDSPVNLGFAAGVNLAADHARGEFFLLLNPDTVMHPRAIEHLVAFARAHPEHGLVGGRTLNPDGTVCAGSCWGKPSLWSLFCFATMLSAVFRRSAIFDPESLGGWQRDTVREVDVVTGCLLLVSREVWRELEGLDPRFFVYGEDADLSLRAAALGYRPAITPDAVVTHEIGVSSDTRPDKVLLLFQGKATLVRKHWGPIRRTLGLALLRLGVGVRALLPARGATRAMWRAVWRERRRWLAGFPAPPASRAGGRTPAIR